MIFKKKLRFIGVSLFFCSCLLSMQGLRDNFIEYPNEIPFEELYKKKFIIDDKKNKLENFIEPHENGEICQAFFTPNDDVCGIITGLIDKEEKSIKVAVFFLTEDKIIDAFVRAIERGVSVEIVAGSFVVLGRYDKGVRRLEQEGATICAYSPPRRSCKWARGVQHNKFLLFEKNIYEKPLVVTGSLNLTFSAHTYNKENISIFSDLVMLTEYKKRFAYLKDRCSYDYKSVESLVPLRNDEVCEALFAPDDDAFRVLQALIHEEKESIKMAAFFLTESDIVDALIGAMKRGVKVELVASCNVVDGKYNKSAQNLSLAGANIFKFKLKEPEEGRMHHKFIVFGENVHERPLLWTGSANFTGSARSYNKENVAMFDNFFMVEEYDKRFDYLKEDLCTVWKYVKPPRKKRGRKKKVAVEAATKITALLQEEVIRPPKRKRQEFEVQEKVEYSAKRRKIKRRKIAQKKRKI